MATESRSLDQRHYGLDWLRVGAFALLILYHLCMVFVTGVWLVKLARIEWLTYPMLFVAPWRLGILFIIAGFAGRVLLAKLGSVEAFAWQRTRRLILPLLFAMAVVIPPQIWVNLQLNHGYAGSYLHFLAHDAFRFSAYDGVTLPGWEHLWFVFYLWLYTLLVVGGAALAPAALKARLGAAFAGLAEGRRLLWLPLLYFVPARAAITFTTGETSGLFNNWLSDAIYLPCFLFGFGLAGARMLWPAIGRAWKPALALALASYAVLVAIETAYPADLTPPHLVMALDRAALAAMMWAMALVMLRLADIRLNRDHRWRARLSEMVFPFYIAHQTIIVVGAWWLLPAGLPPGLAFLILLAATAAGCWLFYRAGRTLPALGPLIGLPPRPAYGRRAAAILRLRTG